MSELKTTAPERQQIREELEIIAAVHPEPYGRLLCLLDDFSTLKSEKQQAVGALLKHDAEHKQIVANFQKDVGLLNAEIARMKGELEVSDEALTICLRSFQLVPVDEASCHRTDDDHTAKVVAAMKSQARARIAQRQGGKA
jgi:uncharacterized small protein (DUF1192 family)